MDHQHSQEQVSQFKEAFSLLDIDKKGRVTVSDLVKMFENMGQKVSEKEVLSIVKRFDIEAKNSLDFKQFLELVKIGSNYNEDLEIEEAYDLFCSGGKEEITTKEIHDVLVRLGDKMSIKDVQDIVDEIGDGEKVTFKEFSEMMK